MMKIVLVFPPVTRPCDFDNNRLRVSPFFPLGIAYLASAIREAGYEVMIRDYLIEYFDEIGQRYGGSKIRYGASDDLIIEDLKKTKADVVGISCLFSAQEFDAGLLCRLARKALPMATIIMGGPHAGASSAELLRNAPELDIVVLGEGERSILECLRALDSHSDFSNIDGLVWRAKDGSIRKQEKSSYIMNLDTLPMPALGLFNMSLYFKKGKAHNAPRANPCAPIVTSRGCPYQCAYCALGNHWGRKQRMRSSGNVLKEVKILVEEYGVKEIHFEDDNLTSDRKRALEIFRGMRDANWDIIWTSPSGLSVADLDEELIIAMKESGCYSISLAIENGDQEVLTKLMHKPVRLIRVKEVVQLTRKHNLLVKGFFILGYPGETRETMKKTIDFARSLELDWSFFFIATPIPHTEMWEISVKKGYLDPSKYDPIRSIVTGQLHTEEFTPKEVEELREEAIISCNFKNNPNLRKYDVNRAIESFKDVLKTYPHFDFAHVALGEGYYRLGQIEKARHCWQEALKYNPENKDASRLLLNYL